MATTLEQISGFLNKAGLRYELDQERGLVITGFATEYYRNEHGNPGILILISLEENGEYIKIFAPKCYMYKEGPHREAVFQACLMTSYMTKLVQFEYDPDDGEVRAIIEFPLEDSQLTEKQLLRCVCSLALVVDQYDETIRRAMKDGVVEKPHPTDPAELMRLFREFLRQRQNRPASIDPGLED